MLKGMLLAALLGGPVLGALGAPGCNVGGRIGPEHFDFRTLSRVKRTCDPRLPSVMFGDLQGQP